jgi:hypothetical protein
MEYSNIADLLKRGTQRPDLMDYLISNTKPDKKGNSLLFSESRVIIGAGRYVLFFSTSTHREMLTIL